MIQVGSGSAAAPAGRVPAADLLAMRGGHGASPCVGFDWAGQHPGCLVHEGVQAGLAAAAPLRIGGHPPAGVSTGDSAAPGAPLCLPLPRLIPPGGPGAGGVRPGRSSSDGGIEELPLFPVDQPLQTGQPAGLVLVLRPQPLVIGPQAGVLRAQLINQLITRRLLRPGHAARSPHPRPEVTHPPKPARRTRPPTGHLNVYILSCVLTRVRKWFDGAGWFVGAAVVLLVIVPSWRCWRNCRYRTACCGPASRLPAPSSKDSSTTGGRVSRIRLTSRASGRRRP